MVAQLFAQERPDGSAGERLTHIALGAAAGVAGTMLMQGMLMATKKWLPQGLPPIRRDPGEHMVHQAERALPARMAESIPQAAETIAAKSLALGYGASFGAAYGALRTNGGSALIDGTLLGLASWMTGYIGWLPATGLMPPVWKHQPAQIAVPAVEHVVYGIATVAAYDLLHQLVHEEHDE